MATLLATLGARRSRALLSSLRNVDSSYGRLRRIGTPFFESGDLRLASSFAVARGRPRIRPSRLCASLASTAAANDEPLEAERSVEDEYSRKTPLEHVLLRPGMYVGPNERLPPTSCWVLEPTPRPPEQGQLDTQPPSEVEPSQHPFRMVQHEYGLVPALIKIFDEILVNASDNRLRHAKTCTRIDVQIDPGSHSGGQEPCISVFNDGKGIPVTKHKKEKMYLPELLFGHLLTGSNFDDSTKRITGGRHGYGAKLTNIFSKEFTVDIVDARRKLRYRQTWCDNMRVAGEPEITSVDAASDSTRVSFVPDLARLTGNPEAHAISKEDYAVMCRRVVDAAGCAGGDLNVTLNGIDVSLASFADYSRLYQSEDAQEPVFQKINSRWTVGVGLSESGSFESVSFVNGMSTPRGGTHVNAIVQQVAKRLQERVERLDGDLGNHISTGLIRRHLFVFCDALIENPTFDSQMKEYLTSSPNKFGSKYSLSKKFLDAISAPEEDGGLGIVEEVLRVARGRQQANLFREVSKMTRRKLLSIPKLEDAHKAGTDEGSDCTLILTEGDSAKALAVAGFEVVGRDHFGVFPLRGKFLNVRHASITQLANNGEVKALCSILGLDFDKEYDTLDERKALRYGRVMIMTDQDADGSHIKGLVVNFFRHYWPKLLKPPTDVPAEVYMEEQPFLSSFVTPLLKATKGKNEILSFYSIAEYQSWRASQDEVEVKKWKVKYYKGLGTSTPAEAKEYFSAFDHHVRPFHWNSEVDGELLDMVFDKERAQDRRDWLTETFDETADIGTTASEGNRVSFEEFVNKEMIHFSHADNVRSIPCVVDGLKPSQRKVLYACFKRKLTTEIKVAQLTGYCAEHTAYHHGEASLQATIIGMAQDFVGSNNINLLVPSGQFGTRLAGGKDAASPRYIFTQLSPITRVLFPEVDDALLEHCEDDGLIIEPEFYCPVIPLLLVNGCQGIGTGWSTFVPPHSPNDVLEYIRAKLDGVEELPPIRPFARGFEGTIERHSEEGYVTCGRAAKKTDRSVLIDELPLRRWTSQYKDTLLQMRDRGDILSFVEDHTIDKVRYTVNVKLPQLRRLERTGLEKTFKLQSKLSTKNMHAFDASKELRRFDSVECIADSFFPIRLGLYRDRKEVLESEMSYTAEIMQNKARFIDAVTSGRLDLVSGRKSKDETVAALKGLGFTSNSELKAIRNDNSVYTRRQVGEGKDDSSSKASSEYDYLLTMPLSSLTSDRIHSLQSEASSKDEELREMKATTAEDLWRKDLDKLEPLL